MTPLAQARAELGQRRFGAAERACRKALRLAPGDGEALLLLGTVQLLGGDAAAAVLTLRRAVAALAGEAQAAARAQLGQALRHAGVLAEAEAALRGALPLLPADAGLRLELGNTQYDRQDFVAAEASYRAALAIDPGNAAAARSLGNALAWQHRFGEARAAYRAAQRMQPGWTAPLFHEAVLDLLEGDLARGFALYEHRLGEPALAADRITRAGTAWRGETAPAGRTVLVHDEQGFGDSFLFARYVPVLIARAARVVLEVRAPLVRLFEGMGWGPVIARGGRLPAYELHCPLPSLPLALGLPAVAQGAYLRAAPAAVMGGRRTVAVAWTAGPVPAYRSIPVGALARLFGAIDADFVVVQKDVTAGDAAVLRQYPNVRRAVPAVTDFADTAAMLAAADLVITVDTAVANLAGAMGRPVWVALAYLADWRWGMEAERSAWFPSARLFRQGAPGDWDGVVAAMVGAVR